MSLPQGFDTDIFNNLLLCWIFPCPKHKETVIDIPTDGQFKIFIHNTDQIDKESPQSIQRRIFSKEQYNKNDTGQYQNCTFQCHFMTPFDTTTLYRLIHSFLKVYKYVT